jgi:hypothetical protein
MQQAGLLDKGASSSHAPLPASLHVESTRHLPEHTKPWCTTYMLTAPTPHTHADRTHTMQDEASRYRASVRTELLHQKASSVPHNIITGEMRASPAQVMARTATVFSSRE